MIEIINMLSIAGEPSSHNIPIFVVKVEELIVGRGLRPTEGVGEPLLRASHISLCENRFLLSSGMHIGETDPFHFRSTA